MSNGVISYPSVDGFDGVDHEDETEQDDGVDGIGDEHAAGEPTAGADSPTPIAESAEPAAESTPATTEPTEPVAESATPITEAIAPARSSATVGATLALGSLAVATNLWISEPAGDSRDRMARAVDAITETVHRDSPELIRGDLISSFGSLLTGTSEYERRALLVELTVANPFSPYWFELTDRREAARVQSLKLVAALSMHLDPDSVVVLTKAWRKVVKHVADPSPALPAGPLIAIAMPAAVGRAGGVAMSAGLAQLGFGSVLGGGLALTGGLWLLGAVDGASTDATQAAIKDIVAAPGFAHLLQLEVCKLVLTAKLARRAGWSGGPLAHAAETVEHVTDRVLAQLEHARTRNDAKAARVRELKQLQASAEYAAGLLRRQNKATGVLDRPDGS